MLKVVGWDINQAEKPSEGDAKQIAEARVKRLLAALDKDGDGLLGRGEAGRAFERAFGRIDRQSRGVDAASLPKKRAHALLAEFDKDGNGELGREEIGRSWVRSLFWRADQRDPKTRRGDGVLTASELEGYFQKREPGRDGLLSTEELQTYYERRLPKRDGIYTETDLWGVYGGYRHSSGNGPRGTPTIDGSRVYVQGGSGDVSCLDFATGKTIWHVSLTKDLGGKVPSWGYSESPLVRGDMVLVTPGGKDGTVAALSKETGEVLWRSTGVTEAATYSTVVPTTIGGIPQFVQFAKENVFGLAMDTGRLLWKYSHQRAKSTINITTPIICQDHVLVSSAYSNGTGLAKITTAGDQQTAAEVYFKKELDNHHGGIVKVGDYVYGFGNRELVCMHFLTGEIAWKERSVGKGSLTVADGMLYLLSERYEVGLAEATHEEYREHGRFKIKSYNRPSWAHPVVAGGRLYIRNQHVLTAYDVSAN